MVKVKQHAPFREMKPVSTVNRADALTISSSCVEISSCHNRNVRCRFLADREFWLSSASVGSRNGLQRSVGDACERVLVMVQMFREHLRAAVNDRRGLETLEYAVFAAAFLSVIAGVMSLFTPGISGTYTDIGVFISNIGSGM